MGLRIELSSRQSSQANVTPLLLHGAENRVEQQAGPHYLIIFKFKSIDYLQVQQVYLHLLPAHHNVHGHLLGVLPAAPHLLPRPHLTTGHSVPLPGGNIQTQITVSTHRQTISRPRYLDFYRLASTSLLSKTRPAMMEVPLVSQYLHFEYSLSL